MGETHIQRVKLFIFSYIFDRKSQPAVSRRVSPHPGKTDAEVDIIVEKRPFRAA
jgi:hypothetical protein